MQSPDRTPGTYMCRYTASMAAEFVHLHVHSEFSMLDGAIRVPQLVEHVGKMGMPAVALTDNGNMFGAVQLVRECARSDVKPILGCEVNFTGGDRRDPQNRELNHLLLLAASQEGYQNLVRLVSAGWVDGMSAYDQPRIDFEVLQRHSKGVVGLSACMGGHVAQEDPKQRTGGRAGGDRKAAGLVRPGLLLCRASGPRLPENRPLNQVLGRLAKELELPLVGTNDCRYLERQSAHAQWGALVLLDRRGLPPRTGRNRAACLWARTRSCCWWPGCFASPPET